MKKYEFLNNESIFIEPPVTSYSKPKNIRENMTVAEEELWFELKRKKFFGYRFRPQHPMNVYILDFYCHKLRLGIEVDGEYHLKSDQQKMDKERTKVIEEFEVRIIRFKSREILNDISGVLNRLQEFIDKRQQI